MAIRGVSTARHLRFRENLVSPEKPSLNGRDALIQAKRNLKPVNASPEEVNGGSSGDVNSHAGHMAELAQALEVPMSPGESGLEEPKVGEDLH